MPSLKLIENVVAEAKDFEQLDGWVFVPRNYIETVHEPRWAEDLGQALKNRANDLGLNLTFEWDWTQHHEFGEGLVIRWRPSATD